MTTLIARLAGPLQAWGAEPKLRVASTHPTPTWSGLLGLARAAFGHGRDAPLSEITWLRDLDMAIRIDQPGTVHVDFHTINPRPESYNALEFMGPSDRGLVPLGTELRTSGQAPRWLNGRRTMVTRRYLIHDAAFLWLVHGPDTHLRRLANALAAPKWALSLGRKSCTPASPLLLGLHSGGLVDAAQHVPIATRPQRTTDSPTTPDATVELVWIHGTPDPAMTITKTRTVLDNPLGSHPQHGYTAGLHHVGDVTAPTTADLLAWAATRLTRPEPETTA